MPTLYVDKMRAAGALDDIVIATTDWARDGKLVHPRADNFIDFDHGDVLIETNGHQYSAEVVVGITDKGESVFYDVVDIQPANFTLEKQEPSTNVTTNKSPDAVHEGSLADSIRNSSGNVNSFSENQDDTGSNPDIRYSSRQRAEVEQALEEYRAQQNEEFRTMKAAYDTARAKIAQEYKLEMEQMESLSGEITARYQNEFLDALMDTEDLGKKGIPQLRKQFRELAEKNSGEDAQALSARKAEYNRLLDEFLKNRDIGRLCADHVPILLDSGQKLADNYNHFLKNLITDLKKFYISAIIP